MYYLQHGLYVPDIEGQFKKVIEQKKEHGETYIKMEKCHCGCDGKKFHNVIPFYLVTDQVKSMIEKFDESFNLAMDGTRSGFRPSGVFLNAKDIAKDGVEGIWTKINFELIEKNLRESQRRIVRSILDRQQQIASLIHRLRAIGDPKLEQDARIKRATVIGDKELEIILKPLELEVPISVHAYNCDFYKTSGDCNCSFPLVKWPVHYPAVRIVWNLFENIVDVEAYDKDYGLQHPHISKDDKQVCWGNLVTDAAKAIRDFDIPQFLDALVCLLSSYNSGDIYYFWDVGMRDTNEKLIFKQLKQLTQ